MNDAGDRFLTASGAEEGGVVVGNYYDKYGSRNPIVRYLMHGFESSVEALVAMTRARAIHEVGCGEGHWTLKWTEQGIRTKGSDFSEQVIAIARQNAENRGITTDFRAASIYDLTAPAS